MSRGKSINLYLIDGTPNERVKCTLANWTGVAYKIPRTMLDEAKNIEHLNQTGVYILFSGRQSDSGELAYVGQASLRKNGLGIIGRLAEHRANADKDYWNDAVVLTTSNNSFGPTEISYLENRFYNLAKKAGRFEVKNGNNPNAGNVTEEKESELEDFIDYARLVVGALGYDIFEPLLKEVEGVSAYQKNIGSESSDYMMKGNDFHARGRQTAEGFVVMKDSVISSQVKTSAPPIVGRVREERSDIISSEYKLIADIKFSSPSSAASFVAGSSKSGSVAWKNSSGKTLGEMESMPM